MSLVLRAVVMLGLLTLSDAARKRPVVSVTMGSNTGKILKLSLDPSVRSPIISRAASSIANMSLSPWTYRDSCNSSRVPMRIAHAQCLTSGCLSPQWAGEDASLEAKPIYYQMLVLYKVPQKTQRNNKGKNKKKVRYDFQLGTELVAVGCTCVRPSVVLQP